MIYLFYNWDIISFQHLQNMPLKIIFGLCDAGLKGLIYCTLCLLFYSVLFSRYNVFLEIKIFLILLLTVLGLKQKKLKPFHLLTKIPFGLKLFGR